MITRRAVGSAVPKPHACVYLDYAATCPIYPDVADAMLPYLYRHWGNPSSAHAYGGPSKRAVAQARERVRALINARDASEIVFCSCGSEADNWAIVGALQGSAQQHAAASSSSGDQQQPSRAPKKPRRHVVVSTIEHPAILACVDTLEDEGRSIATRVGCDGLGLVDPQAVAAAVVPGATALVSVMLANNEVGSVADVAGIASAVKQRDAGVLVHTDAAQAVGKIDVDVQALGVDLLTLVGHKFGAPKGVAALYVRKEIQSRFPSLLWGGGQERGRRAGTEAVPNLVALGEAAQVWLDQGADIERHSTAMRDRLLARLEKKLLLVAEGGNKTAADVALRVNGPLGAADAATRRAALPNVLSIGIKGLRADAVLASLRDHVAASAGAACHTGATSISGVLLALRVPEPYALGTLRLSVGRHTTPDDVDEAADRLADAILADLAASAEQQSGGS